MKRLIAVLLVLVGTAAMSFAAGTCRFHGAYDGATCPGCLGGNARMEGRENPCINIERYPTDRYICNTEYKGNEEQ